MVRLKSHIYVSYREDISSLNVPICYQCNPTKENSAQADNRAKDNSSNYATDS